MCVVRSRLCCSVFSQAVSHKCNFRVIKILVLYCVACVVVAVVVVAAAVVVAVVAVVVAGQLDC